MDLTQASASTKRLRTQLGSLFPDLVNLGEILDAGIAAERLVKERQTELDNYKREAGQLEYKLKELRNTIDSERQKAIEARAERDKIEHELLSRQLFWDKAQTLEKIEAQIAERQPVLDQIEARIAEARKLVGGVAA